MSKDERQHAVLVHLPQLIATKVAQLLLVDHAEAAIDERLLRTFGLDRDLTLHQQAGVLELLHEGGRALPGCLELLAEVQDRLGRLAGLVAVEQGLALLEVADRAGGRSETE